MKRTAYFKVFIFATLVLLLLITGCAPKANVEPVEGEQADEIAAQVQPIAENLLQGLNDNDYAAFSQDFDGMMKTGMDEKAFTKMKTTFDEKIGMFVSMEVDKVEKVDNYYSVTYKARFEKEDGVTVRVTIDQDDPPQVAGIWFTSPKLRTQ